MSGPVVDALAQLEDAILESGLDKQIILVALVRWLDEIDRLLERDMPRSPAFWDHVTMRQKLWDHVAVLDTTRKGAWLLDDLHKATLEKMRRASPETFLSEDEQWVRMENARTPGRYVIRDGRIHDTRRRRR